MARLLPHLTQDHREDFSVVATAFRDTFYLSKEEDQALWCVQCLRNILAHGVLSAFLRKEDDDGPALTYLPRNSKNNKGPCRNCPHYPRGSYEGVVVAFGPEDTKLYFDDLRTVGKAVKRIALSLGLRLAELV